MFTTAKKNFPEVANALEFGLRDFNYKIEDTLAQRALGFTAPERHEELVEVVNPKTKAIEMKLITTKIIHRHYVPDVKAQELWLINRSPDKWKARHHDRTPEDNPANAPVSDDELMEIIHGANEAPDPNESKTKV